MWRSNRKIRETVDTHDRSSSIIVVSTKGFFLPIVGEIGWLWIREGPDPIIEVVTVSRELLVPSGMGWCLY